MKSKRIILFLAIAIIFSCFTNVFAAAEYAKYISSIEDNATGHMDAFALWSGCQLPVKADIQQSVKYDGLNALKLYCTDKEKGNEWHASSYWDLDPNTNGNWTGAQYLEFWIKNDTGIKLPIQIQFTERGKTGQPDGEPWRVKVKTTVLYEENGKFVERSSDVSNAEDYNEFSNSTEGAVEVPKNFTGRIRIAINSNNFRRAEWFLGGPGSGANNTIDKGNIAQLSFTYDPRIMENNAAWYLDSVKLVAPNANLAGSVEYGKLKAIESGNTDTSTKSSVTQSAGNNSKAQAGSSQKASSQAGEQASGDASQTSSGGSAASDGGSAATSSGITDTGTDRDDAPESNGTMTVILIAAAVLALAVAGILFVLFKDRLIPKK